MSFSGSSPVAADYKSLGGNEERNGYEERTPQTNNSTQSFENASNYSYNPSHSPYAYTASQPEPHMINGTRIQKLGKKFSFWKKKPKSTNDVYYAVNKLMNSHAQYCDDFKEAFKAINDWGEYFTPGALLTDDELQKHMIDPNMTEWLGQLVSSIKRVHTKEKMLNDVYKGFTYSFDILRKQESLVKDALKKKNQSERKYFKAMAKSCTEEYGTHLDNIRNRLAREFQESVERFHQRCRFELPLRFGLLMTQYGEYIKGIKDAIESMQRLLAPDNTFASPPEFGSPNITQSMNESVNACINASANASINSNQIPDYPVAPLAVRANTSYSDISRMSSLNTPRFPGHYPGHSMPQNSTMQNGTQPQLPTPMESPEENEDLMPPICSNKLEESSSTSFGIDIGPALHYDGVWN